jgi:flagellar assembly protein FliH
VFSQTPREHLRRPSFMARLAEHGGTEPASFSGTLAGRSSKPDEMPTAAAMPAPALDLAAINAQVAERIANATELLRQAADRLAAEARSDALEVGFMVARRILEAEVSANVESLLGLVRSALRRLGESRHVVIHLSPEDAKAVEGVLATAGTQAISTMATTQIELAPDASLGRGDCMVEGDLGTVDGRINTRLEELRQALRSGDWQESP